jgi:hypothetical protein
MTDNQKQWTAWGILTLVTVALSLFLGVKYPLPTPPAELPDSIVELGVTHMTALELSGSETDELVVNQTSTGDIAEFKDNGAVVWRLSDGGNIYHNGELDLNGQKLDLDADADTSLEADTDDQIDWEIGGADLFVMKDWTATALTDTTEYLLELQDTTGIGQSGTNAQAALNIDVGIGDSTAGTNAIYGILIDGISQDDQNTEKAISVGSGWDIAADFDAGVTIDGGVTNIGGGTPGSAAGDNDLYVTADLEVDGVAYLDGGHMLLAEAVSANNTIAATECGKTFFLSGDDHTQTLPAVSGVSAGCEFRFIIAGAPTTSTVILTGNSDEDVLIGGINELEVDTNDDGPYDANADTITFIGGTAVVGDFVYMISDGSYFYVSGQANADGGITITDSD